MSAWLLEISLSDFVLDFSIIGVLLIIATILRRYIRLLQEFLIPNNLIAGVIGMVVAAFFINQSILDSERLGSYVYHLLALLFIALGLRKPSKGLGLSPIKFGVITIMVYLIQAIIGMGIAMVLIYTIMPDLFPAIGMLAPLGFGMNPGIAYSIGNNWENFGFIYGGTVGLSFAAFGFIIAYSVGILAMRKGVKEGRATYLKDLSDENNTSLRTGFHEPGKRVSTGMQVTSTEAIESFTLHFAFIAMTYAITYGIMKAMEYSLILIEAEQEILTLWSFHFIIAAVVAMFVRRVIDITGTGNWVDDPTMTRMGNMFMDIMVVASVAAITIAVVSMYWIPLLLMGISVALSTWFVVKWACKSLFKEFAFERYITIFGNVTGTLQSGLLLLRVLDPKFKSPVSFDLVYGSGFALLLGFPMLILINAPVNYFNNSLEGYWLTIFAMLGYLTLVLVGWNYLKNK
jgi:ESS family glutamate:Na+ symporter